MKPPRLTRQRLLHVVAGQAGSAGYEAAVVDVAQDFLLAHLQRREILDLLAFKGGTALRKLHAGSAGRFSLDLDFSVAAFGDDASSVLDLLAQEVHGLTLGPFDYAVSERRGKRQIEYSSAEFATDGSLISKLDVSAPPWLPPVLLSWVPMPQHEFYGFTLPSLTACALEENLAEKIVRLNRATPARDMYDLAWVGRNVLAANVDVALTRRLAVLKNWVDAFGMSSADGTIWTRATPLWRWILVAG